MNRGVIIGLRLWRKKPRGRYADNHKKNTSNFLEVFFAMNGTGIQSPAL
jgi:hypothetical protein